MAYLTAAEYLDRYGERETILITNETPGGTQYDSTKLGDAIDDITAEVEGYIGTKYIVPLVDVPRVVKGWVAVLTRERLYVRNPPPKVKDDADIARGQMRDIATGKFTLPVAEGDTPPETTSGGMSTRSNDAECPTFTRYKQVDFMAPFFGGADIANWRRNGS